MVLGIGAGMDYTFPFDVKIQLNNVGGPSAGQMFALGIIDKLTPGELNGGKHVAGTGTIDNAGNDRPDRRHPAEDVRGPRHRQGGLLPRARSPTATR